MTVLARTSSHSDAPRTPTSLRTNPLRTALRLAADPSRWRPHLDFDPDRRYYRRLVADEHHEAWLLTWLPGQGTDWHDHGGSGGAFVVLQGSLVEGTAVHGVVRGARGIHPRGSPTGSAPTTCTASRTRGPTRQCRCTSTRHGSWCSTTTWRGRHPASRRDPTGG